ncbi:unnamed protein product [Vitrella brassicaformis CCMP3155]|uniref:Uncharacterized protein n=1 Tax=Vitrella brassicaformis (strain CCMP3155) TaxID=1169540 RepID=A0A0G4FSN3_VITBC|nr:unnamed protein product [Vitrella brassicaformis CCMP3155]|eukprot:CEM17716.1 unnamed protein product [Vitrella brassicaformis CCMP3155]
MWCVRALPEELVAAVTPHYRHVVIDTSAGEAFLRDKLEISEREAMQWGRRLTNLTTLTVRRDRRSRRFDDLNSLLQGHVEGRREMIETKRRDAEESGRDPASSALLPDGSLTTINGYFPCEGGQRGPLPHIHALTSIVNLPSDAIGLADCFEMPSLETLTLVPEDLSGFVGSADVIRFFQHSTRRPTHLPGLDTPQEKAALFKSFAANWRGDGGENGRLFARLASIGSLDLKSDPLETENAMVELKDVSHLAGVFDKDCSGAQGGDSPLALQRRDSRELTVSGGTVEPRNLRTEGRLQTLAFSKQKLLQLSRMPSLESLTFAPGYLSESSSAGVMHFFRHSTRTPTHLPGLAAPQEKAALFTSFAAKWSGDGVEDGQPFARLASIGTLMLEGDPGLIWSAFVALKVNQMQLTLSSRLGCRIACQLASKLKCADLICRGVTASQALRVLEASVESELTYANLGVEDVGAEGITWGDKADNLPPVGLLIISITVPEDVDAASVGNLTSTSLLRLRGLRRLQLSVNDQIFGKPVHERQ